MMGRTVGRRSSRIRIALLLAAITSTACAPELGPSPTNLGLTQTFGEKFFTIACQRVAYTSSLRAAELASQDPTAEVPPVDVAGTRYRVACRLGPDFLPDFAADQDPKVATFVKARASFVEAIDLIFPEDQLPSLQDYMVKLLPLSDDDSFPDLVRKAGAVMQELEDDPELKTALYSGLARLDTRVGYRPRAVYLGLIREVLGYTELQPALSQVMQQIGEGGPAHQAFLDLMEALGFELRDAQRVAKPGDSERTLRLALNLLTTQSPVFAGEPSPVLLVRRDARGLASVKSSGGKVPAPFVDKDGDGVPDMDGLGRFVTSTGTLAPAPFRVDTSLPDTAPARDSNGRALDGAGQPLYDYVDLDTTVLAALARDSVKLLDSSTDRAFQLAMGATGLLGDRMASAKAYPASAAGADGTSTLPFTGFDTAHAPLLDLLYSFMQVLRDPTTDSTLDLVKILLRDHEGVTSRLVGAALDAKEIGKKHPEAQLEPTSNLYDDLVPLLRQVAYTCGTQVLKPGQPCDGGRRWLLEDVMDALADARTRNLPGMLMNYFNYRDVYQLDATTQKVTNPGFHQLVDRTQPDTGTNRSLQQRLFHMINNTNGMKICNKENACFGVTLMGTDLCLAHFKTCDLFEVDNGALFYTQSIACLRNANGTTTYDPKIGRCTPKAYLRLKTENMPGWLSTIVSAVGEDYLLSFATKIDGMSTHPTTEAVNRQMFVYPMPGSLGLMQDPGVDVDGHIVPDHLDGNGQLVTGYHQNILFAWEQQHPQFSCNENTDPCYFYQSFRPTVQAFADHDSEKLFLDILSTLHRHWASRSSKTFQFANPKAPDFAWGSAAVTWEPLIAEVLKKGELFDALCDLGAALKSLKLSDGTSAKIGLTLAAQGLLDPARTPGLAYRDGRTQSYTTDSKNPITGGVSPFYLLADAFAAKRAQLAKLATGPNARLATAWNQSTSDLVDIFLGVEKYVDSDGRSSWRFSNRRLPVVAQVVVDFLRGRLAVHKTRGDTDAWLSQELPADVERVLAGPAFARAADLIRILDTQPAAKKALYDLASYLITELTGSSTFRTAITGLADVIQMVLDDDDLVPVAHALGRALDPARGLIPAALRFLWPALDADSADGCSPNAPKCGQGERCITLGGGESRCSREMLTHVLRNAWKEQSPGKSPVQTLLDLSTELHRLVPGAGTPYTGADFAEAFRQARDFLVNTETGLVKFFEIIKARCDGPCPGGNGQ
jgi:hypothetical protein